MMLKRQRHLLSLLSALGGTVGKLDFQKLLFLQCQEAAVPPYEFVPYKFGAFSFTSYADRRKLVERHLVTADDHSWTLTELGRRTVAALPSSLGMFEQDGMSLRGDALVAYTYRRFPYYATRSEIAERVLEGDVEALTRIRSIRRPAKPGLLTIGYEGHSLEGYLNTLIGAGVTVLCDVRRNPLSRKYGFSKRTLEHGCTGVGIRYEHLPELGIDSAERRNLDTQSDYDVLFERYEQNTLPTQEPAIARIAGWIRAGEAVSLTCYEHAPHQCHRHCVAEAVERTSPTFRAQHL